ncbi:MAG: NUDIX domain-containing protein [Rhodoferax sp.]|nr:NUDIX domain-containing protein [Rhodoferax sp.]
MNVPLVADPQILRPHHSERPVVDVAVGILVRDDGFFLLTSRPTGKAYAGYWEFPGGKVEPGESVATALRRELEEELGITLVDAQPWRQTMVDYPHALVKLHFCKVYRWTGALLMRESQSFAWQTLPVSVTPILPGTVPVLEWLAQEAGP